MAEDNQKDRTRSWRHTDEKVQLLLQLYGDILEKQKQGQGAQPSDHHRRPRAVRWKSDTTHGDSNSYNPFRNAWSATAASASLQSATPRTRAPLRKLSARQLSQIHERTASPIFHSDPSVIIKESNPATEKDRGSFTASSSAGFTPKAPSPSQWFQKLPVLGSRSQQMTSAPTQPEPQGSISQSPVEAEGDTTLQQLDKLVHSLLGFDSTTLPMIDGMEDAVQEAIAAMAGGDSRAAAEAILKGFGGIDEERDRIACDNWNVI